MKLWSVILNPGWSKTEPSKIHHVYVYIVYIYIRIRYECMWHIKNITRWQTLCWQVKPHFHTDYGYIKTTTHVRISQIIAIITPHSGYIRTVPNGSEVSIFSPNYFELFRTISNCSFSVPGIPPNGSERFRGSLLNLDNPAELRQVQTRLVQIKLFLWFYLQDVFIPSNM